jgi:hypothetical protein
VTLDAKKGWPVVILALLYVENRVVAKFVPYVQHKIRKSKS